MVRFTEQMQGITRRFIEPLLSQHDAVDLIALAGGDQVGDEGLVRRVVHLAEVKLKEDLHRPQS